MNHLIFVKTINIFQSVRHYNRERLQINKIAIMQRHEGIFDIQTYQKAIDRMSCSSSLEQMANPKSNKRLTFSQAANKLTNYPLCGAGRLKQQIKPHQARQIVSRITEIIKSKKQVSKFLSADHKNNERIHQNSSHDKKVSYSAYINARKRIFERQNPISYSASVQSQNKQEEKDKNNDIFAPDLNQQLRSELQIHSNNLSNYMNNTMNKYQRIRLEGIVTKKRIQVKKTKQVDKGSEIMQLQAAKTRHLARSFITVIKKRSNQSHLMINSTKQVTSQRRIQDNNEPFDNYVKNFAHQTRLQEQEIQIYPQISNIVKLRKPSQNCILIEQVNSKSATILHYFNGQIKNIFNMNEKQRLQIASITKTMTCYLVLTIADKFCVDIKKQKLIVSERASKMQGTSAKLAYSDVLTVYEMLHALMLPSGNDAAIALGEWGGKQIRKYSSLLRRMKVTKQEEVSDKSSNFLATFSIKRKSHLKLFIHHMNKLSRFLGLSSTHFVNTHGLMNEKAYSCSQNISMLTYYVMSNSIFRQIVKKQAFRCRVFNRTFSHSKEAVWQNTNKLLGIEGFLGVKTGITPSAGPCLTSYFEISSAEFFIVTILKTKSCEMRFKETINLLKTTLLHLINNDPYNNAYKTSVANLEGYCRQDFRQDEKEFLNNCRESTESNQSNDEQNEQDFNEFRVNF